MKETERQALLRQIQQWNDDDEFSKCIHAIEQIPSSDRDYLTTLWLGRAYSNLAVLGDRNSRADTEVDDNLLGHAIEIFESIREHGEQDPMWNARMGYAYIMYQSSVEQALHYAKQWVSLAPNDENAKKLLKDCERALEEATELERDSRERKLLLAQESSHPPEADDVLGHVIQHINTYFGRYTQLIHDDSDLDHPLSIAVIPPRVEHDYYTLVTIGLSLFPMNVPEELADSKLNRAELLINLPKDWKLSEQDRLDNRWNWPIRMLLATAHFPIRDSQVWLGSRDTLGGEDATPFDEGTKLNGSILLWPGVFSEASFSCVLPDEDEVNFYQVIPLYPEELHYKLEYGSDAFLDLCPDESLEVIKPQRLNVVTDIGKINYDCSEMDDVHAHQSKAEALGWTVDPLASATHMAIFLHWGITRNHMSNPFVTSHKTIVEDVRNDRLKDLRPFVIETLGGKLNTQMFDCQGSGFAQWYNQNNRSNPYVYLRDYRDYALGCLKGKQWSSPAEEEAAYLKLRFSELNQAVMEKLIDQRFKAFLDDEYEAESDFKVATADVGRPRVLLDWDGPLYCYASDRIGQDGCQARRMVRILPEREERGWESGWFFLTGDEAQYYGSEDYEEKHCGFYDLREICAIDPSLVPFLTMPYDTIMERDEQGQWYLVHKDAGIEHRIKPS